MKKISFASLCFTIFILNISYFSFSCDNADTSKQRNISSPGVNSDSNDDTEDNPICGNAIIELDESCDDGNIENGDGCSSLCSIEEEPVAVLTKVLLELNFPSFTEKRFSIYVYNEKGKAIAGLWASELSVSESDVETDIDGKASISLLKIDENNCIGQTTDGQLDETIARLEAGNYSYLFLQNTDGVIGLTAPSVCNAEAGFLTDGEKGISGSFTISEDDGDSFTLSLSEADLVDTFIPQISISSSNATANYGYCAWFHAKENNPSYDIIAQSFGGQYGSVVSGDVVLDTGIKIVPNFYSLYCFVFADNSNPRISGDSEISKINISVPDQTVITLDSDWILVP